MGAWIETKYDYYEFNNIMSHPTWVRGLKLLYHCGLRASELSHPTWVRGLKQSIEEQGDTNLSVAPYVGAWIET